MSRVFKASMPPFVSKLVSSFAGMVCGSFTRSIKPRGLKRIRSFSKSDANSAGGVPPCFWSISGRVLTPRGHGTGAHRATHLKSVRLNAVLDGLMYFSPKEARKESLR